MNIIPPYTIHIKKKILGQYTGLSFFLWIWIYVKDRSEEYIAETIRHEKIHFRQQLELGFIIGWLVWAFLSIRSHIKYGKKGGYRNHPWEREAYANEHDLNYLKNRKFLAWIKYY